MTKIELEYVQRFRDRHGKVRHYFRRPGFKRVPLPGLPGAAEFMAAYADAAAQITAPARQIGVERTKPGSISALAASYYSSRDWSQLADETRRTYRHEIERFRAAYGHLAVAALQQSHIVKILDKLPPGAAKNRRRVIGVLMRHAVERGWRKDNPTVGMRRSKPKSDGYLAWSEEDIDAFALKYPLGTREYLALALLLYTAQRRSDVVKMGQQHVKGGKIHVVQQKTGARLWIPIHPRLAEALATAPTDHLTFLIVQGAKPFSVSGFGQWFSQAAQVGAGLVGRSAHGLRKAAARRLAEAGCTTHQIAAVTGHRTLSELSVYTRSADQKRLADEAMQAIGGTKAVKPG